MQLSDIPFGITDWTQIEPTQHPGDTGTAQWRTRQFGSMRVRMADYSPNYLANHWCEKGHIVLCLLGELTTELADGTTDTLTPGMSYQVADGASSHRSRSTGGATLFIVD
ncbi:MAG: DHCW motif cupin fold protein [Gemmatimonadaceae bacterium]